MLRQLESRHPGTGLYHAMAFSRSRETTRVSDLQFYNVLAGLTVLMVFWGSLAVYALRQEAKEAKVAAFKKLSGKLRTQRAKRR